MTDEELRILTNSVLRRIQDELDVDIVLFLGPVAPRSEREFNECLKKCKQRQNILLMIATFGGSADVAYQLVRAARRHYPDGKFTLFVDSVCKSAGTLIALGADEIVMSDTAELGPLDVQIQKPEELGEMMSGLTSKEALNTLREEAIEMFESSFLRLRFRSQGAISTRTAAELAVKLAVGLFDPIYAHFDPMRLGEHERSNRIAMAYGELIRSSNVKDSTLERLIAAYPSHNFVIDRDEARKLFMVVREPTEHEVLLGNLFHKSSDSALSGDAPIIRRLIGDDDEQELSEKPNGAENADSHSHAERSFPAEANGEPTGSDPQAFVSGSAG